ncbi:MAG: phosphoadenosine phosphosulfate reductase, partial [Serratia sp.]|nr:phosphoadenosine phosphosulfate reductase [Serratia sp. (in: enterobacteria)]
MSLLSLAELNELPKSGQSMALAEINASLEKLSAQERVQWALENMPGEFALSSSFGIQAAVCLHLVTQQKSDIP